MRKEKKANKFFGGLLSFLRVRTAAAGLEVSDQALRLAYVAGKERRTAAVVLGPGVMKRGTIQDPAAFAQALAALRAKVPALANKRKKMHVVVSLGSATIYTQSFNLPIMDGDELKKAIELNVQMSAPDDLAKSYHGARILLRDEGNARLEISASFIERKIVDDIADALYSAGFVTICVESRALSLVRVMCAHAKSLDLKKSYLVLDVDDAGMDFLIVRNGELYFEYPTPWSDLADAKGQVGVEKFDDTLSMSMRQVSNFYNQHWQDPLAGVVVSSIALRDETAKVAASASSLPVTQLTAAMDQPVAPEWAAAFGAQLRGMAQADAEGINLSGEVAADRYRKERVLNFLELWQVLVPAALGIFVVTLALAYNFLASTQQDLATNDSFAGSAAQEQEVSALEASSTAFNQLVQLALSAQSHADIAHAILDNLSTMAATTSVNIDTVSFQGTAEPVRLSGVAPTQDDIVVFKNLVDNDPHFGTANLPLSNIQPAGHLYSFTMTFPVSAGAF